MTSELFKKIEDRTAIIGIIGLGYVGLPLVRIFANAGYRTMGFDVDQKKVETLLSFQSYIKHIGSDWIKRHIQEGKFEPTSDMSRLGEADVILVCVPTPLNESRDPDLFFVEETTKSIAKTLRKAQLVVLESTTYPGTTRDVMLPILEAAGMNCESDFFLAYSPEREDPGNPDFSADRIPKVVGGIGKQSLEHALAIYSKVVVATIPVSSCEVAEACKILENTYRCVNIAMVNELKVVFQELGIDIWEVINAAKTKPFGFQAFYPGPGLGGHCIPIDPFYLSWLARTNDMSTKFIELAGQINTSMPMYVIDRIIEALNSHKKSVNGSHIGILGLAYKKDVDDCRESPTFKLIEVLKNKGATTSYHDPYFPRVPSMRKYNFTNMQSQELTAKYLTSLDCLIIATDHSSIDYEFVVENSKLIVDTRNATGKIRSNCAKIWMA